MDTLTPFSVQNKVAIVTGAGSGINFEFAKLLAERGCNVVIGDISLRPEAAALVDQQASSPRVLFQKIDVTNWTDLSDLFAKAVSEFGTIDIVCPGAGIFEPGWSRFWEPPGSLNSASKDPAAGLGHYATIDINFTHPIRATQLALAEFLNPSDGSAKVSPTNPKRIVHIGSVSCQQANLLYPIYTATKHGLTGFVRSMGHLDVLGIRVNAVAPGVVRTPLWTDHQEKLQLFKDGEDIWVTPGETAEAMLRLLEDPEMVGGTILEVGHDHTRVIPLFGNEGPKDAQVNGLTVTNRDAANKEVWEQLSRADWGKPKES